MNPDGEELNEKWVTAMKARVTGRGFFSRCEKDDGWKRGWRGCIASVDLEQEPRGRAVEGV